jgi:hypothetical protein
MIPEVEKKGKLGMVELDVRGAILAPAPALNKLTKARVLQKEKRGFPRLSQKP